MKKSKFTETQIVIILKEADAGLKVADVCRKHGISQPTYYNWKSKYGSMSPTELKRVKELEAEHSKLKRMYADLAMENDALKELIESDIIWLRSSAPESRAFRSCLTSSSPPPKRRLPTTIEKARRSS